MNKRIFSLVWNRALGQVTVASELAKQRGGSAATAKGPGACRRSLLAAALLLACASPLHVMAATATAPPATCSGLTGQAASGYGSFACGPNAQANAGVTANTAIGAGAVASGDSPGYGYGRSTAVGAYAAATDANSTALGAYSHASGYGSTALGTNSSASGRRSVAVGIGSAANYDFSTAVGGYSEASGEYATAIGESSYANGKGATALGHESRAVGNESTTIGKSAQAALGATTLGYQTEASGNYAVALGAFSSARGEFGTAVGTNAYAGDYAATALGHLARASRESSMALGSQSYASSQLATAVGTYAHASGESSTAVGSSIIDFGYTSASGLGASAFGAAANASGDFSTALGARSFASSYYGVAIGARSSATGDYSVALGAGSVASQERTVSVGNASLALYRRIVNVDNGIGDFDAVNVSQLYPFAAAIGGGASFTGGALTAPTFTIQGTDYHDVGSALGAIDTSITDLYNNRTGGVPGPAGPQGPAGVGGNPNAVAYDDASHTTVTLDGGGAPARISNVAAGTSANDAVNVSQMDTQVTQALQTANTYADADAQQTLIDAKAYTDQAMSNFTTNLSDFEQQTNARFHEVDKRIDQVGAMGAAWAGVAQNTSSDDANNVAVGFGSQGGRQALAVGYKRVVSKHASFSFGGSAAGDDHSVSAGVGFHW